LPVTKAVSAERLRAAIELGLTTFGENRVQEAEAKATALPQAKWQLIGRLQSNKAGRAVELFEAIQSVESVELARRLDRLTGDRLPGRKLKAYLEVNVDGDPAKAGFSPTDLTAAAADLSDLPHLELAGLMTVGRLARRPEDARTTFSALRRLSDDLRGIDVRLGPELSMGMSADFEVAIEEGATIVRLGSAIFGPRQSA
jgi:PLP dependent protein